MTKFLREGHRLEQPTLCSDEMLVISTYTHIAIDTYVSGLQDYHYPVISVIFNQSQLPTCSEIFKYRIVQKFDSRNFDEFDKWVAIHQSFSLRTFRIELGLFVGFLNNLFSYW